MILTGAFANLLLNALIVVLLSVTIAYCWVLNRRIKVLQDSRGELALLLKHFDDSTQRASDSIINLQTTSKRIGEVIQSRITKCNDLMEDLAYMIDKGEKIASKMEASFAVNRARNRVMEQAGEMSAAAPVVERAHERVVERTVEKPLPKIELEPQMDEVDEYADVPVSTRQKTASTLEAVLSRVVNRNKAAEPVEESDVPAAKTNWTPASWPSAASAVNKSAAKPSRASSDDTKSSAGMRRRSQAEQELLDMIKFGIKG